MQTKTMSRVALFGGALVTAGLAHASPSLEFSPRPLVGDVGFVQQASLDFATFAYQSGPINGLQFVAPIGTFETSANGVAASSITVAADELAVSTSGGPTAYSTAMMTMVVQQAVDTIISIEWETAMPTTFVTVTNMDNSVLPVFDSRLTGQNAGSMILTLEAGVLYELELNSVTQPGLPMTSTASLRTVPTPGAAGLLGTAGLLATRRRRR